MRSILSFLFIITLWSCNTSKTASNAYLSEAKATQSTIATIDKELDVVLDELVNTRNGINVQGRQLTDAEIAYSKRVYKLENQYHSWKENWQNSVVSSEQGDKIVTEQKQYLATVNEMVKEADALQSFF